MKQFVLREPPDDHGVVRLAGADYHYLVHVRRVRAGAVFRAALPGGGVARVTVRSVDGGVITGECRAEGDGDQGDGDPRDSGAEQADAGRRIPPIYLFQGMPRAPRMDLIARQAAELGVEAVIPFVTEFSVWGAETAPARRARLERWRKIVREARQQSGSATATDVRPPRTLDEAIDDWAALARPLWREGDPDVGDPGGPGVGDPVDPGPVDPGVGILLHPRALATGGFHEYLGGDPGFVALAVGPEGGFSEAEAGRFIAAGFRPLAMGGGIMRSETAALYALAAARTILWEKRAWEKN